MFWTRNIPAGRLATISSPMEMFSRFLAAPGRAPLSSPAFNLWADEDGAVLTSELAGVRLEDVDITVSGKSITVKGTRNGEETGDKARQVRNERPAGAFERTFQLGFQVDASRVEARLTDGVLEVTLPRAENDKPRKIIVTGR